MGASLGSLVIFSAGAVTSLSVCWSNAEGVHRWFAVRAASTAGWLLDRVGLPVYTDGTALHSAGWTSRVSPDQSGLIAAAMVVAASLTCPLPLVRRCFWAVGGSAVAFALAALRLAIVHAAEGSHPAFGGLLRSRLFFSFLWVVIAAVVWLRWLRAHRA